MKKTALFSMAFVLAALPVCGACAQEFVLMTGLEQSTSYQLGSVIAGQIHDAADITVTVVTSADSQASLEAIEAGDADLAIVSSDIMYYAYEGFNTFDTFLENFLIAADLYLQPIQIVTCNPDIQVIQDLKGKNVALGTQQSGVYFGALDILGLYGLTEDSITPVYESFEDCTDRLLSGEIDAAFVIADAPSDDITALGESGDLHLIGLDDDQTEALVEICPYYSRDVIKASVYDLEEDITTLAVSEVLVARSDMAEEDVHDVVSAIFENADKIKAAHARGADLDLEFAASIWDIPYHDGATMYFDEKNNEAAAE